MLTKPGTRTDCAIPIAPLYRPCIRTCRFAIAPVCALENDLPLHSPRWVLVDFVAQCQRVHLELDRKLIDGLLESEAALGVTRGAERRTRTRVDEDVVLFRPQVRALVHVGRRTGGAGSCPRPGGSVAGQLDRGQRFRLFLRRSSIAGASRGDCRQYAPWRRSSISLTGAFALRGEIGRHHSFIAGAKFRPETTTHELGDHAYLALGQFEDIGKLFAYTGRPLGRGVDGYFFRLPIDYEPMGLKAPSVSAPG